jgi:hypothetical protein
VEEQTREKVRTVRDIPHLRELFESSAR